LGKGKPRALTVSPLLLGVVALVIFAFSCIACSIDEDKNEDTDDNTQPDDDDSLTPPMTSQLDRVPHAVVTILNPPSGNLLARQIKIVTNWPCSLTGYVTDELEPGLGRSHPEATPPGTEHFLRFFGLVENRQYQLTIHLADHPEWVVFQGAFSTPTLPAWIPRPIDIENNAAAYRDTWVAFGIDLFAGGVPVLGYIMLVDRAGQIRFVHEIANMFAENRPGPVEGLSVLENGDIVIANRHDLVAARQDGSEYVLFDIHLSEPLVFAAHHEFYIHEDEPVYATILFNRKGVGVKCDLNTPTDDAVGDGIAEIGPDGRAIWRWSVFEHKDDFVPSEQNRAACVMMRGFWGPDSYDWTHANNVAPVPGENAYLMSFRNISRVVKIDRETGDVQWQMGWDRDFEWIGDEPEEDRWFSMQHDSQVLPNGNILLFDNSNCRYNAFCTGGPWSRALELEIDEINRTVRQVWEHRVAFSPARGGVQRLPNGNTIINSGFGGDMYEVTPAGEEIWHVGFAFNERPGWAKAYPALWDYEATP